MQVSVFGPVAVDGHGVGELRVLPGRLDRRLVGALALNPQRVRSVDELLDAMFIEALPTSAKTLRNRVSSLRSRIGRSLIETVGAGYCLGRGVRIDANELHHFTASTDAPPWRRGRPFEDIDDWEPARPEIVRLERLCIELDERRAGELAQRPTTPELLAELDALVAEQPYREQRLILLLGVDLAPEH